MPDEIMALLEPITFENVRELRPGEWIWDNRSTLREIHAKSLLVRGLISEPIGFRQIDILDLKLFPQWSSKPFRLTTVDKCDQKTEWVIFEEGRFYRFRRKD